MTATSLQTPKDRPQPNINAFKSTGFVRKIHSNSVDSPFDRRGRPCHSSPALPPCTPSKPSLQYYRNNTNSSRLNVLFNSLPTDQNIDQVTNDFLTHTFDTVDTLGSGFSSTCLHVVSRLTGKHYAIKRTKQEYLGFNDRQLKIREVEIMSLLMSRRNDVGGGNVVMLHAAWEQAGILFMQLEYLPLGSLESYLNNCNFEVDINADSVGCIVGDLLLGLGFIHSLDVIHLDLKPSNILISQVVSGIDYNFPNLRFKIGDFGLAIRNHSGSEQQLLADNSIVDEGDKVYMAAEILQNNYGKHCDIFSLGLVLLEIISNCSLPDQGDVWTKLRQANFEDVPQIRNEFLPLWDIIRLELLNPNFRHRPSVNELLLNPLLAPVVFYRMQTP